MLACKVWAKPTRIDRLGRSIGTPSVPVCTSNTNVADVRGYPVVAKQVGDDPLRNLPTVDDGQNNILDIGFVRY